MVKKIHSNRNKKCIMKQKKSFNLRLFLNQLYSILGLLCMEEPSNIHHHEHDHHIHEILV